MRLAIFDFDGTITRHDSFLDFIIFCHGLPRAGLGLILNSPFVLLMVLKLYPRGQTKERIWEYFFQNWSNEKFERCAQNFVNDRLPRILRPKAVEKLNWHKAQGHRIVVASASFENYLKFWTKKEGFDLIATQGKVLDGNLTGKFATPNCHGEEKARRLRETYDLKDFDHIYAYGDSKGDLALKQIANEFHYKPFRNRI